MNILVSIFKRKATKHACIRINIILKNLFKNSEKLSAFLTRMETRPSPTKSWGPLWGHWVRTPRSRNYRKWYRKSMLTVKITHLLEWYWCLGNGKVFYHYAFSKRVFLQLYLFIVSRMYFLGSFRAIFTCKYAVIWKDCRVKCTFL